VERRGRIPNPEEGHDLFDVGFGHYSCVGAAHNDRSAFCGSILVTR
jgi:hypothetical protein